MDPSNCHHYDSVLFSLNVIWPNPSILFTRMSNTHVICHQGNQNFLFSDAPLFIPGFSRVAHSLLPDIYFAIVLVFLTIISAVYLYLLCWTALLELSLSYFYQNNGNETRGRVRVISSCSFGGIRNFIQINTLCV